MIFHKSSATKTRRHKKKNIKFKLLSKKEESTAEKIIDAAVTVHKVFRPGKHLGFLINFNVPLNKTASIELYYNLCVLVP